MKPVVFDSIKPEAYETAARYDLNAIRACLDEVNHAVKSAHRFARYLDEVASGLYKAKLCEPSKRMCGAAAAMRGEVYRLENIALAIDTIIEEEEARAERRRLRADGAGPSDATTDNKTDNETEEA